MSSTWAAANINPSSSYEENEEGDSNENNIHTVSTTNEDDNNTSNEHQQQKQQKRRKLQQQQQQQYETTETDEAILARLTHAYNAAMNCVGAVHRASEVLLNNNSNKDDNIKKASVSKNKNNNREDKMDIENDDDANSTSSENNKSMQNNISQIVQACKIARTTFESNLLYDPIIGCHAPMLVTALFTAKSKKEDDNDNNDILITDDDEDDNVADLITFEDHNSNIVYNNNIRKQFKQKLTSNSHNKTVKKLAYLTLVNYADLLFRCCTCSTIIKDEKKQNILEGGPVSKLSILSSSSSSNYLCNSCCWKSESMIGTYKLCVAAYYDASTIESSDPNLWFKLASSIRCFDRCCWTTSSSSIGNNASLFSVNRNFQSSECYAINMGYKALGKPHLPPNRLIDQAWKDCREESRVMEEECSILVDKVMNESSLKENERQKVVCIDLPRYCWSTLGRLVMKVCREGSGYNNSNEHSLSDLFPSPMILFEISPMLALPPLIIGMICEYLSSSASSSVLQEHNTDVKSLECTCKALSIIVSSSARSEMDRYHYNYLLQQQQESNKSFIKNTPQSITTPQQISSSIDNRNKNTDNTIKDTTTTASNTEESNNNTKKATSTNNKTKKQQSNSKRRDPKRSSKRVQSQNLLSEQQAERNARRNSVEYCIIGTLLGFKEDHPMIVRMVSKQQTNIQSWERELVVLQNGMEYFRQLCYQKSNMISNNNNMTFLTTSTTMGNINTYKDNNKKGGIGIMKCSNNYIDESSLSHFIQQWSNCISCNNNSGPYDVLYKFILHVGRYVTHIYSSTSEVTGGAMLLSPCILECIDIYQNRSTSSLSTINADQLFVVSSNPWIGTELSSTSTLIKTTLETFALNLLNAELRTIRLEKKQLSNTSNNSAIIDDECQEDRNIISYTIYKLLVYMNHVLNDDCRILYTINKDDDEYWFDCRVRCHWLAAIYHIHIMNETTVGYYHIDEAISLLKSKDNINNNENEISYKVYTPHLEYALHRDVNARHWKELSRISLSSYKHDLLASTVMISIRQRFCDLRQQTVQLQLDTYENELKEISKELFHRYYTYKFDDKENKKDNIRVGTHLDELIHDFISIHHDALSSFSLQQHFDTTTTTSTSTTTTTTTNTTTHLLEQRLDDVKFENKWKQLWKYIPPIVLNLFTSQTFQQEKPSLLYILLNCLSFHHQITTPLDNTNQTKCLPLCFQLLLCIFSEYKSQCCRKRRLHSSEDEEGDNEVGVGDDEEEEASGGGDVVQGGDVKNITTLLDSGGGVTNDNNTTIRMKRGNNNKQQNEKVLLTMSCLLMDKLSNAIYHLSSDRKHDAFLSKLSENLDVITCIQTALSFVIPNCVSDEEVGDNNDDTTTTTSKHNFNKFNHHQAQQDIPYISLFHSACGLLQSFLQHKEQQQQQQQNNKPHKLEIIFFACLSKFVVQHRHIFPNLIRSITSSSDNVIVDKRTQKNVITCHSDFVALTCVHLSHLLSRYLPEEDNDNYDEDTYSKSCFIHAILSSSSSSSSSSSATMNISPVAQLIDSLLWFWKYSNTSSSVSHGVSQRLIHPIAATLVSITGAVFRDKKLSSLSSSLSSSLMQENPVVSISNNSSCNSSGDHHPHFLMEDFMYDSDDSAADCAFHDDSDDEDEDDTFQHSNNSKSIIENSDWRWWIRRFRLTAHCINLVFIQQVDDKDFVYLDTHGPLLPLVVARVLTYISDVVLKNHYKLFILPTTTTSATATATTTQQQHHHRHATNQYVTRQGIWGEIYPLGMSRTGEQCDNLLYRAYRYLHGFTLSSVSKENISTASTSTSSTHHHTSMMESFHPESILAATRLYRCIKRAYTTSKGSRVRIPPKAALEYVASALPNPVQTKRSQAILKFLFCNPFHNTVDPNNNSSSSKAKLFTHLMVNNEQVLFHSDHLLRDHKRGCDAPLSSLQNDDLPEEFPKWVLLEEDAVLQDIDTDTASALEIEAYLVRKSLCHDLAQGPLPELPTTGSSSTMKKRGPSPPLIQGKQTATITTTTTESVIDDDPGEMDNSTTAISSSNNNTEQRDVLARHEKNLFKKFLVILEDLCYSPTNWDGWFQAAECLSMKAELICDRLMPCQFSYDANNFCAPASAVGNFSDYLGVLSHDDLVKFQEKDMEEQLSQWLPCIGDNLKYYIKYPWATFSSLQSCSIEITNKCKPPETDMIAVDGYSEASALSNIKKLYDEGDYPAWQRAWGGLYISSLRLMSRRCRLISLYIVKHRALQTLRKDDISNDSTSTTATAIDEEDDRHLISEILEHIGTFTYIELQGKGTLYGYPIQIMPQFSKRLFSQEAAYRFNEAIDWTILGDNDINKEGKPTDLGDLYFMLGKCQEKVANTHWHEMFPSIVDVDNVDSTRAYAMWMTHAVMNYASAYNEAKQADIPQCIGFDGGSSHGDEEKYYRLHATRLKVLLRAVKTCYYLNPKDGNNVALILSIKSEVLQILAENGVDEPQQESATITMSIGQKFWKIALNVTDSLAQCRKRHSYFHRSVYRHAQAILWLPFIFNESNMYEPRGSALPVEEASNISGLSISSGVVPSAMCIVKCLFDKKRVQLCAVWVTCRPSSTTPFEVVNESSRKFDALRMKYIGAYIDCLRLCLDLETLNTLFSWTYSCCRDLPAAYESSAKLLQVVGSHNKELLRSISNNRSRQGNKENLLLQASGNASGCGGGFLWFVKSRTNSAIARVIIQGLVNYNKEKQQQQQQQVDKSVLLEYLKTAYNCFLHLNCPAKEVLWRAATLGKECEVMEMEALIQAYLCYEGKLSNKTFSVEFKMALLCEIVEQCRRLFLKK